ncbi:ATP-binding protein [Sulfurimonas sp. SWIR-19]|uniref:HP0729 family protein n=1 Tax=Sulfurimonas sp. SWIR-19 TaxID=2878390 RepID=UPI001CF3AD56|nr:HP0729 family protein [Sulfurimonas sp. SWIR-19]UCN00121.1 ATP-binding protein [Sulfurimonas sp. SWIR-19]
MQNLLILYNPYYKSDVIEQHLEILKNNGVVAFGKLRSKLRDYDHPNEEKLDTLYESVSAENPLQLFLTDYDSIYVANVIAVKSEKTKIIKAPSYYDTMDVEKWFIFDDLRLIIDKNFAQVRDSVLANFKAVNYNNRTYAVYGNKYVYPMQVTMKEEINYFEKEDTNFKYYTNIFKTPLEITTRQNLIEFTFGEDIFYALHPNTQDNIISAEIEFSQNKHNPLYDYSAVIMKYSKAIEAELHNFFKTLVAFLIKQDATIANIPFSVQGMDRTVEDIALQKANYGTYKFLLKNHQIKSTIQHNIQKSNLKYFILSSIPYYINTIQNIRNESVHGNGATLDECKQIRKKLLGIGDSGFISELISGKDEFEK